MSAHYLFKYRLSQRSTSLRGLFDRIKARHGSNQIIHLFPALPASLAVETGRVWMPKADLTLQIYDEIRDCGFVRALAIGDTHMGMAGIGPVADFPILVKIPTQRAFLAILTAAGERAHSI